MEKIFYKCSGNIRTGLMSRPFSKCTATASVQHEGKWYCKRHDPKKKIESEKRIIAKFNAEYARRSRENAAVVCIDNLVKAVKLVLALNKMDPVKVGPPDFPHEIEWIVRLDPKAKEQLETAVKTYEDKIEGIK